MNRTRLWLLVGGAALGGALVSSAALAQTPTLNTAPKLTLQWLRAVSVSPISVTAGASAQGTVTLLRPAAANMSVKLVLIGSAPIEGVANYVDGVQIPTAVTIPAGKDRASFVVTTTASPAWAGTKTFVVNATYGSETVKTSFTVSR